MTISEAASDFVTSLILKQPHTWWEQAAIEATIAGHSHHIIGRQDESLYLSRFWLTSPIIDDRGRLESGNSTLLHFFHRGDDDEALHDHPWDFNTTVLSGGYTEQLPPPLVGMVYWKSGPELLSEYALKRRVGDRVFKKAHDLHMAMNPLPDTWTLVTTGARSKNRDWGFHPPGKKWVPWQEYLGVSA